MSQKNATIRDAIASFLMEHGETEVRDITKNFATQFHTTPQRIAGNISCMVCIENSAKIVRDYPHSKLY